MLIPSDPTPHAYIMAGDAHWRYVGQHVGLATRNPHPTRSACPLDNAHFAHDLKADVAQHHEVGIALAERESDGRFVRSSLYQRARSSAACLRALAQHYEEEPPDVCVDISKLKDCLAAPLLH